MQSLTLKLKQASAVLGVTPKDLQNLVQLGVIRPARRNRVCWFDTNLLLEAKVAFYLKETLGSSSDLLARFTEAFRRILAKPKWAIWGTSAFALVRLTAPMLWRSRFRFGPWHGNWKTRFLEPRLTRTFPRAERGLGGRRISCGTSGRPPLIWATSQRKRF